MKEIGQELYIMMHRNKNEMRRNEFILSRNVSSWKYDEKGIRMEEICNS